MDLGALPESVDTVIVAFTDAYGRLVGKRLDAGHFRDTAASGAHACNYLLTVDMEMEPVDGYAFAGWTQGYGDMHLTPDMDTLRVLSWQDRTALVLCDVDATVAPRTVLRRQVDRLGESGYGLRAASELEYFLYRTSYADAARSRHGDLEPAGWYVEDYDLLQGARTEDVNGAFRRHLRDSGVPVESTKGEWGRGQHELNIRHAPVLEMADRHVVLKQCCKEVADSLGASVTFMAKPDAAQAGSSCHIHASLWRDGTNVFVDGGGGESDEFRWFLGGLIAHAPDLMALYAPTVNSYKRYRAQSWAPTTLGWARDNRTAGFRVVGSGDGLRIENRLPGADVNPYLAYAATIASGLAGIDDRVEPPEPVTGDAYDTRGRPPLPADLGTAVERLDASDLARTALGDDVVDHYVHFARTEWSAYGAAVTDWERSRYFERI